MVPLLKLKNNKINLFFVILFFALQQLLIIDYVFFQIFYSSYFIYVFTFLFLFALSYYFYKINAYYMFSLLPLSIAVLISYLYILNLYVFFIYLIFAMFVFYVYKKNYTELSNNYEPNMNVILFFAVFSVFIVILTFYVRESLIVMDRDTIKWFLCLRGSGEHINLVYHSVFNNYSKLILPFLFLAVIFFTNFLIFKNKISKDIYLILILIFFTFSCKFVIAYLSDTGLNVVKQKIESKYNCSYYYFANEFRDNVSDFIGNYTSIYQKGKDNAHIKGHPILPVLLYWLINKFISINPFVSGIVIALLSSLTIIPLFYFIKFLSKNNIAAYFGGLFYGLAANSSILSIAGIDSIIVLFLALTLYFYFIGLNENKWYLFFISGISFGINSYLTFGLWYLIPFLFLYFFIFEKNIQKNIDKILIKNFLWTCFYFIAGIIISHLFFYAILKGNYNYFESFNVAKMIHKDVISGRPYKIWVWLNFIHWTLYVSTGVVALYLYRYILALTGKVKMDSFSIFSLIILIVQFLSCTGRAETHRMWMYLIIFVLPVAIMPLLNKQNKINQVYANIFVILIFINSVLIEMFITDAH